MSKMMTRKQSGRNHHDHQDRRGHHLSADPSSSSGSPTRHGSELDQQIQRILRRRGLTATEKANQIFLLLETCETPLGLGGKTPLEIVIRTLTSKFEDLDPREVPGLVYIVVHEIVANRKWDPTAGLAFLAYVINGVEFRIRSDHRNTAREIPFSVLAACRQSDGSTDPDQDRFPVFGALDPQIASYS